MTSVTKPLKSGGHCLTVPAGPSPLLGRYTQGKDPGNPRIAWGEICRGFFATSRFSSQTQQEATNLLTYPTPELIIIE